MTTLAPGASATINLNDGGLCVISTSGGMASITVTPQAGTPTVVSIGPLAARQTFGPYPEGAVLIIANQSAGLDYDSPSSNLPRVLAQSGSPTSVTGTTAETTLASITVPGGLMGLNGMIKVTPVFSATNNANSKTLRVRFAGNSLVAQGVASFASVQLMAQIRNRNSLSSQGTFNALSGFGTSASAVVASAVDTSQDQLLTITGTLAVGTDTLTLEGYTVEYLPGN